MTDLEALDYLQERVAKTLPDARDYGRWVAVARLLDVSPARVWQWRVRGRIAFSMRPKVREVLNAHGCRLPKSWALPPWLTNGGNDGGPHPGKARAKAKQQTSPARGRRRARPAQVEGRA